MIGQVFVGGLPSGIYKLRLAVSDESSQPVSVQSKRFFIYNPELDQTVAGVAGDIEAAVEKSVFQTMTEKEIDEEFKMATYIASDDERNFYKKLNDIGSKRKFVYEFWAKKDPVKATMTNELRTAYLQKIEEANQRFRSYTRAGWRTDRGRVFILYGEPSDIEENYGTPDTYNHEIWEYDGIEGGVEFVFVDFQEFGEFMQMHSTKRGEPQNTSWESAIQK